MMTPLLPLLEKPTKQELPQPARTMAANIAAQRNTYRRLQRENHMDCAPHIRRSVEAPSQASILRPLANLRKVIFAGSSGPTLTRIRRIAPASASDGAISTELD